jgi:hypothetical protein
VPILPNALPSFPNHRPMAGSRSEASTHMGSPAHSIGTLHTMATLEEIHLEPDEEQGETKDAIIEPKSRPRKLLPVHLRSSSHAASLNSAAKTCQGDQNEPGSDYRPYILLALNVILLSGECLRNRAAPHGSSPPALMVMRPVVAYVCVQPTPRRSDG